MSRAGTTLIRGLFLALACLSSPLGALDAVAQQTAPTPVPAPSTSCTELTAPHPGAPCSFDFSGIRQPDERLLAIEQRGIPGSGLFPGVVHIVRTAQELNALSGRVQPGDQIVLADGSWRDAIVRFQAKGERSRPIVLRPQSPGGVVFTGTSSVKLWGQHLIAQGLEFRDGVVDRDNVVVLQMGGGAQRPCDSCIVNRLVMDNINPEPAKYEEWKTIYLGLQGRDITVANSQFMRKENVGTVVHATHPAFNQCGAIEPGETCTQRLMFTDNVMSNVSSGVRRSMVRAKVKLMEIGSSQTAVQPAFSIVENNVFQNTDGGTNTVVIKASDVIVRNNRFLANLGTLNLRSSNRTLVQNNLFDGSDHPGMGGVLIQGSSHWIVGNRFKGLSSPRNWYHYPIAMSAGAYEDLDDNQKDYARVKAVVIADNVFENALRKPIVMGIYPRPERGRTLNPVDVHVLGNTYSFSGEPDRRDPDVRQ